MKCPISIYLIVIVSLPLLAGPFDEFAVSPSDNLQEMPDINGDIVVWQEYWTQYQDYDIFALDIMDASASEFFLSWDVDQINPKIYDTWVVFQDNYYGDDDQDVILLDISDPENLIAYDIANSTDNEICPDIHGNTIVFQSNSGTAEVPNWDIAAADIVEPNNASLFYVDTTEANQTFPAIYRDSIVYDESYAETPDLHDIWTVDIWLQNDFQYENPVSDIDVDELAPAIFDHLLVWQELTSAGNQDIYLMDLSQEGAEKRAITTNPANQINPDISRHLIVWQDDRAGNWDIYGYNLVTGQEFAITTDPSDQTDPAVSGNLVVWADMRDGVSNIYAAELTGAAVAECSMPLPGDTDGNCQVNMADFANLAESWLLCNLEPEEACNN